jgi:dihydroxyacid dehydratase/phosphogluconate dehydratase
VAAIQQVFGAVAPEAAVGGLIATVKEGDSIAINGHKRLLQLNVPEDEITRRRAAWKPPVPRYTRGAGVVGLCRRGDRPRGGAAIATGVAPARDVTALA